MGKKVNLSVVILAGEVVNKESLLRAITSARFSDEIIKIDTAKIKGSYSEWRNEGMKRSKGNWVLYLDSDEEITTELKGEISYSIDTPGVYSAFAIPRRNFIFGQEFKHGGQWPDYQKRLFLRSKFIRWNGPVHEEPEFKGELGHLTNPLLHHKNMTISQMIDKTNEWSELEASLLFNNNHPKMNCARFLSAAYREFFLRFVKQKSFLDGSRGTIYGIYQIYSKLITYSKLWEKQLSTTLT